jgi:hypothetical protein
MLVTQIVVQCAGAYLVFQSQSAESVGAVPVDSGTVKGMSNLLNV